MNVFHVECLQGIQKKMCTDNQNVNLGPRRKVWIGEADLRVSTRGFGTQKENMEQEEKQAKDKSQKN